MANVNVTSDAWTEISITSGTVQNISATADIELSAEQTDNSGVVLKPSELYQWDNETIYARAVTEEQGALRVVNFKRAAGGGGYVLPVASSSTLGGVKVGLNLSIDGSGVLSATGGGSSDYDPVGRVVFDVVLRNGYIKGNGATVADASTAVPDLLQFVQDNPSLVAANQAAYDANVGLYLYDSGTDALTLPDYTGRTMQGGNSIESVEAGLPNIKGKFRTWYLAPDSAQFVSGQTGAFSSDAEVAGITSLQQRDSTQYTKNTATDFNASRSSAIYSDSVTTVQPPAIKMIPQIKY